MESQVAAAKSMSGVKSVQELFELQSGFAKTAMESYMAQMGKVSEIFTASMKDAVKPINERVTATVEAFQAARGGSIPALLGGSLRSGPKPQGFGPFSFPGPSPGNAVQGCFPTTTNRV